MSDKGKIGLIAIWTLVGVILAIALAILLFSPAGRQGNGQDRHLRVVVSIYPLQDLVRWVGGDRVQVDLLLKPGASPHTYEPTPRQMIELSRARLFFTIGLGLEPWAARLGERLGSDEHSPRVIALGEGLELMAPPSSDAHKRGIDRPPHAAHDHQHHRTRTGMDPHVWLDPIRAKSMLENIARILIAAAPEHEEDFRRNLSQAQARLDQLHEQLTSGFAELKNRRVVTFHSAFVYLFARYGIILQAVLTPQPGQEPSIRYLRYVAQQLDRADQHVIFAEPQLSRTLADRFADEIGGSVVLLDPVGGTFQNKECEGYAGMMRCNMKVIRNALLEGRDGSN